MARTNNLTNFLTDIADSIREKKGTTEQIPASSFDTEIASIETGGGNATLQEKSITITENGIVNILPDAGYDALSKVNATVNVGGEIIEDYIQDGLIAWFESEDKFDSENRLKNRKGDDYLKAIGSRFDMIDDYILSQGNCPYITTVDYYATGNTVEVVGYLYGKNSSSIAPGWLVTGNCKQSAGIGCETESQLRFINDSVGNPGVTFFVPPIKKIFSSSVRFTDLGTSPRNTAQRYIVYGSLNGGDYRRYVETNASTHNLENANYKGLMFLSYYNNSYTAFGYIKSIRIYNKELTNEEMKHNYEIDKQRFNIIE